MVGRKCHNERQSKGNHPNGFLVGGSLDLASTGRSIYLGFTLSMTL